jgi:hypothetical protein
MRRLLLLLILAGFWLIARLLIAEASIPEGGPDVAQPQSQLVVTPLSFFAEVPVGEDAVQQLFVGNTGPAATLEFTITVLPFGPGEGIVDWLSYWPAYGSIAPGAQTTVDLTFSPKPYMPIGSLHSASLRVGSNSLLTPTAYTLPLYLLVVAPVITPVVTPTALAAELPIGATSWQTLTLGNEGNATLAFTLTNPAREADWLDLWPPTGTVPPGAQSVLTATFDAAGQAPGLYTTTLALATNSTALPILTLPASLSVRPWAVYLPLVLRGAPTE